MRPKLMYSLHVSTHFRFSVLERNFGHPNSLTPNKKWMKIFQSLLLSILFYSISFAQNPDFNLTEVGNVFYEEGCNEVWGFQHSNGTEYAIQGTRTSTAVLSLDDPANPEEVVYVEGSFTTWRDMKTWGDYVYSVCDNCDDGLVIIDMTDAENPRHKFVTEVVDQVNSEFRRLEDFHNIFIDEFGYLYACGGFNSGGVVIFDVHTDPWNPEIVGYGEARYAHDIYVRDRIIYASNIYDGFFSILDASDFGNIQLLATQPTTGDFTHNAWLSDDGDFLFTTDEVANAYVDAYDISDYNDIQRIDKYRPPSTEGRGVIPHNTHYFEGYLVTSWYTDGVKIVDAKHPDNLIEVASFDTWDGPDGGYEGNWGAYPYLPSGLLLVSDRESGLFVLQPDYQRASYLEGTVRSGEDGDNIIGADILIEGSFPNQSVTDNFGSFKTGIAASGIYDITFSHPLYRDTTIQMELFQDSIIFINMIMEPMFSTVNVLANVHDANGVPIADIPVIFSNEVYADTFQTDVNGSIDEMILDIEYDIFTGHWGYGDTLFTIQEIPDGPLDISLPGDGSYYRDRFLIDQGWFVSNLAETGDWEMGVPVATQFMGTIVNPGNDSPFDIGDNCYGTGLIGQSAGDNDVDGTFNTLYTPVIELLGNETEITLDFDYWFVDLDNNGPINDTLEVLIFIDGLETERIATIVESLDTWRQVTTINLLDHFATTGISGDLQVAFRIGDYDPGSPLEAGVDNILIELDRMSGTEVQSLSQQGINFYPNPVGDVLYLDFRGFDGQAEMLRIFDIAGHEVARYPINSDQERVHIDIPAGMYILSVIDQSGSLFTDKFVKN